MKPAVLLIYNAIQKIIKLSNMKQPTVEIVSKTCTLLN